MDRSELAIVIPAFNEERTIGRVVRDVAEHGLPIVVNDASRDRTRDVALRAGAVVVDHESNQGYDAALGSGFREAERRGCSFVVTFDADGQHDPRLITAFLGYLREAAFLVLGVRPTRARLAEYLFSSVTKALFGMQDPLCGMKGYRLSLYKELGHFDSYRSVGTELALYAARRGYPYVQIQVPTTSRKDSPRFGRTIAANMTILHSLWVFLLHLKRSSVNGQGDLNLLAEPRDRRILP